MPRVRFIAIPFVFAMLYKVYTAETIWCYSCPDGEKNNGKCNNVGDVLCGKDQVCSNNITDDADGHRVVKYCEDIYKCFDAQQTVNPTQCRSSSVESRCVYCCNSDRCNTLEKPSDLIGDPRQQQNSENGRVYMRSADYYLLAEGMSAIDGLQSIQGVQGEISCAHQCLSGANCSSFAYSRPTNTCDTFPLAYEISSLVAAPMFSYYVRDETNNGN
ncbi:uncharacterized protein LOC144350281 [Saccoglossus kowalevskii]